jgi:hypothetical protein
MQHGRWDMARDHLTAAMSRATQSVNLLLQRMRAYIHLEQYPEAVSDGASALKLDSSNIDAYQVSCFPSTRTSGSNDRLCVDVCTVASRRGTVPHGRLPNGHDTF